MSGIYRLDNALVALNEGTLFDGNIDNALSVQEDGTGGIDELVWTGSLVSGLADFNVELGGFLGVILGRSSETDEDWIHAAFTQQRFIPRRLYAISEELTVVPVPGAFILGVVGLATCSLMMNRKRRTKSR